MRSNTIAIVCGAIAFCSSASPIIAADWSSFYIGMLGGAGETTGDVSDSIELGKGRADATPTLIGGYAGWTGELAGGPIFGLEGALVAKLGRQAVALDPYSPTSVPAFGLDYPDFESRWESFATARVGLPITEAVAVFASAGLAIGEFSLRDDNCPSRCSSFALSGNDVFGGFRTGYTVGASVDVKVDDSITMRAQYQFADYGNLETVSDFDINVASSAFTTQSVTVGIAYSMDQ